MRFILSVVAAHQSSSPSGMRNHEANIARLSGLEIVPEASVKLFCTWVSLVASQRPRSIIARLVCVRFCLA